MPSFWGGCDPCPFQPELKLSRGPRSSPLPAPSSPVAVSCPVTVCGRVSPEVKLFWVSDLNNPPFPKKVLDQALSGNVANFLHLNISLAAAYYVEVRIKYNSRSAKCQIFWVHVPWNWRMNFKRQRRLTVRKVYWEIGIAPERQEESCLNYCWHPLSGIIYRKVTNVGTM